MKKLLFISFLLCCLGPLQGQGLKGFKLPNGLTVYIWEDPTKPDVYGMVGVNVGATQDPETHTGLAHYLEHVLFKGTQKIGTTGWEKEKPIYDQIIAKYDEMAAAPDTARKNAISREINQLTKEASQYMVSKEFFTLTEEMGGENVNAGTSWDYTMFYNTFPPGEIYRWLDLYSERLINPVYRTFQSELEAVYEEYNRSQDAQGRQIQDFMLQSVFPGHPYARSVLGLPEHLKSPQLSELIKFYDEWYTPENMVLILVGNVKASQITGIIQNKFGRLAAKESPARKEYPDWDIHGRNTASAKISPYPQLCLAYKGVPLGHPDKVALDICLSILSNSSRTGLLDKLTLDGDLMGAYASLMSFKDQGRILLTAIPAYDINLKRFNSLRDVEKDVRNEIKKLADGNVEEWLINSVKGSMIREFDLSFESSENKAKEILSAFINHQDINEVLGYKEKVASITLDEIKAVAKKYFTGDYLAMDMLEGKGKKADKIDKPKYEPIIPPRNVESEYAKTFAKMPVMKQEPEFCDFNKVAIKSINERSKLFYTKNEENEVFSLTLKYGVGLAQMPKLEYAVQLMNNAGIMGMLEPQELKQAFSELGVSCHFAVDNNYLYVQMYGYDARLQDACNLLTRQILMPKLDEKQLNSMIGSEMQSRRIEKEYLEYLKEAMREYLFYQEKSKFIDRLPIEEIQAMSVSSLTGEFSRATDYEAEVHYAGTLPLDTVYNILGHYLPLKAQEKESLSPIVKEYATYGENTVFFLPDDDAQQSTIYFLIGGKPYSIADKPVIDAFNQYFGEGFNGLVLSEIREYRSMAYSAGAAVTTPLLPGKNTCFYGIIGTQADKTIDAMDVFMSLINDMPQHPERTGNIKEYLEKTTLTAKPSFRSASQMYEYWKRLGYREDPAKSQLPAIEKLTFDDILNFYNTEIKGKPVAIGIVGDPKRVDVKQLEKYGKVIKLNKSKLFSTK